MRQLSLAISVVALFLVTAFLARFLEPRACIDSRLVHELFISDMDGCAQNSYEALSFKSRIEALDRLIEYFPQGKKLSVLIDKNKPFVSKAKNEYVLIGLERARSKGGLEREILKAVFNLRAPELGSNRHLVDTIVEFIWTVQNGNWVHEDPYSRLLMKPSKIPDWNISLRVSQSLWKEYQGLSLQKKRQFLLGLKNPKRFSLKVAKHAQVLTSEKTQKSIDLMLVMRDRVSLPWFQWSSLADMGRRVYIHRAGSELPRTVRPKKIVVVDCHIPKPKSILKYQSLVARAVYVRFCGPEMDVNWWTLVNRGVESFAREHKKLEFMEFHLSSLKLAHSNRFKKTNEPTLSDWGKHLHWQDVKWDREIQAYRPWGPMDGVTLFRLAKSQ